MDVSKVDLVTLSVSEAFKGASSETIEIATSADGDAGYKFAGGTWLKEGQTYLVYAYKRESAGAIPDDLTEENYGKDVAAELLAIYKAFPKQLAAEINEFNSKISPYSASVCGRTRHSSNAAKELEQIRKIFPEAKRFNTQADAQQVVRARRFDSLALIILPTDYIGCCSLGAAQLSGIQEAGRLIQRNARRILPTNYHSRHVNTGLF